MITASMIEEELRLALANDFAELARVADEVVGFLERHGVAENDCYTARLTLEEVLSNIIRHGYDDDRRHEIAVRVAVAGRQVELDFVDDGREFDPTGAPAVDVFAPLAERRVGGLGIHLVRSMARDVRYERTRGRNHLSVRV